MPSKTRILAVIPARKNSSFKSKNLFPLAGKALIEYTLDAVKESGLPCVISSDDERVLAYSSYYSFIRDERPPHLADSISTLDQVLVYISKKYPLYENYMFLPPTSPLRTTIDIKASLEVFSCSPYRDCLVSVTEERRSLFKRSGPYMDPIILRKHGRQQEEPFYIPNGAIFITSKKIIEQTGSKIGGRIIPYVMPQERSVDIHNEQDIRLAEFYLGKSHVSGSRV